MTTSERTTAKWRYTLTVRAATIALDSYAFDRKQKYFNKPQVKLPQVVG